MSDYRWWNIHGIKGDTTAVVHGPQLDDEVVKVIEYKAYETECKWKEIAEKALFVAEHDKNKLKQTLKEYQPEVPEKVMTATEAFFKQKTTPEQVVNYWNNIITERDELKAELESLKIHHRNSCSIWEQKLTDYSRKLSDSQVQCDKLAAGIETCAGISGKARRALAEYQERGGKK